MKQKKVTINNREFLLPDEWEEFLSDDVKQYKQTLRSYLKQYGMSLDRWLKIFRQSESFVRWYDPLKQRALGIHRSGLAKMREKHKLLRESVHNRNLLKKFGTTDVRVILGEDVLSMRVSIFSRLSKFGIYDTNKWCKAYLPKDLYDKLMPVQPSLKSKAIASSLSKLDRETLTASKRDGIIRSDSTNNRAQHIASSLAEFSKEKKEQIMAKRRATNITLYGMPVKGMRTFDQVRDILVNDFNVEPLEVIEGTPYKKPFKARCLKCGNIFETYFLRNKIRVCPKCALQGSTLLEKQISEALENHGLNVVQKYHPSWLFDENSNGIKEVDIFLPELNIGFEINGAFSHNSGFSAFNQAPKPKNYHAWKTERAAENGVSLFHIWEHWNSAQYSCVKAALSKANIFSNRIFARKLEILYPNINQQRYFYLHNHRRGYTRASFSIALSDGNEILQMLSFTKESNCFNLVRNATKQGCMIIGGFKRLLAHSLIKLKELGGSTLITYADRDISPIWQNTVYARVGMSFEGDSGPLLEYWVRKSVGPFNAGEVVNRRLFQKHKLEDVFRDINFKLDQNLTEQQNLARLDIYPIYNSGCFKFSLEL